MNDRTDPIPGFSIGAVERETGLSKDTLRVWERRYRFPQPIRDAADVRSYPPDQVEKLRLIKRLLDQGHRPRKVISLDIEELRAMAAQSVLAQERPAASGAGNVRLLHYLSLCKAHRVDDLRHALAQSLLRVGLDRFVLDIIAPFTDLIGDEWARGGLAVFEEHLYTEVVQTVMRNAISAISMPSAESRARPRILLTTFPQEQHGLGLLMAEAILVLEGAHCTSLGTRTPIMEIVQAVQRQHIDIVALSFSAAIHAGHVREGLRDLKSKLQGDVEIWAGGSSAILRQRPPAGIHVLDLLSLPDALSGWRATH